MASILIRGGLLFDGDALSRKDIFTKDGKIAEIADEIDREADFVCEANSQLVTPGLVDIHAHLRGLAPTAFGFPAELATLPFGVTAACDAGSSLGNRETLEALPIGAVSLVAYSGDGERDDARLAAYGERAIGIKVYFDTDLSPSVNAAYLEGACAYARERGLTVMVHCSNSPIPMSEIVTMLAPGDILTHTYHGGRHTAEEGDFAALRSAMEKGVLVDAGMAGHVHTDFGVLARCLAAGLAPDTIGSDITNFSAYTRGGRYGLTMCMSIARRPPPPPVPSGKGRPGAHSRSADEPTLRCSRTATRASH